MLWRGRWAACLDGDDVVLVIVWTEVLIYRAADRLTGIDAVRSPTCHKAKISHSTSSTKSSDYKLLGGFVGAGNSRMVVTLSRTEE